MTPAPPPPPPQPEGIPPTLEEALAQEQKITDEYPYFRFVSFGGKKEGSIRNKIDLLQGSS